MFSMFPFSLFVDTVFDDFQASGPTYDVSSNQVVRLESATGLNSHWVGHWITTTEHLHFILITFTDVVGGRGANGCLIYSLETGGSSSSYISDTPTTIGQERLKIQFGEQYELLAAYTTGTFTINGTTHKIDSRRSTTWYDRQWGDATPTQGWHWFPIQLDNGIRISAWVLPTDKGSPIRAFATALYPNGRQEVVSVNPDIKPSDPWVSSNTNRTWFGSFEVSFLDEYNSVIKAASPDVTTRHFGEAAFGAGFAWKGEEVSGWGVVEQWPAS
ncbi:uncharacterized protein TrAtP1_003603 [Trichoderma atroviride]|uniref:uncharacterized protein n=1 Tax=Hypocrea atroviridis TaxID=63577 RepID=UPI00332BC190|nr:hypothetical protein TrAtP1_003603 [Trichoderma atroviride]